jgi:O-antigen/teichoic acid export membrane protein
MNDLIFLFTTAAGVTIILFNSSFLNAWVGKGHFAGTLANLLIIIMIIQDTFIKNDGFIINANLDLKKKVYLSLLSTLTFIALGFPLVKELGITGLCISLIMGKLLLFIGQRYVLKNIIRHKQESSFFNKAQPILISLAMLAAACYLSYFVQPLGFIQMLFMAPITFMISFTKRKEGRVGPYHFQPEIVQIKLRLQ